MCAIRFATEFVRDNDKYGGLSLAQWIVLPIGAVCLTLLLSRPRADGPRRVLTSGARRATIGLIGGLAVAALSVGLPALESTLLMLGASLVLIVFIRGVGRVAPTGLAVLALQMPAINGDSAYPRTYKYFGAGANWGSWTSHHQWSTCDGPSESWDRDHSAMGATFETGSRTIKSATRSRGMRALAFVNVDQVGQARNISGSQPAKPAAYSQNSVGFQIVSDIDWHYFGLSLGASMGQMHPAFFDDEPGSANERVSSPPFMPAVGLRMGPQRGVSVELRVGDEAPSWMPAPAATATLGFGDGAGNSIRVGTGDGGALIAGRRMLSSGIELMPMVLIPTGSETPFQAGVSFRRWFRAGSPPPGGR